MSAPLTSAEHSLQGDLKPHEITVAPISNSWLSTDWDFSLQFDRLEARYQSRKRAIPVNFRALVPVHSGVDRATHLLHSYPAKLLANIPIFFLNCHQLRVDGGVVLDPFCGTGTVLLEAVLAGYNAIGADTNPLARLIAVAKLTPLSAQTIEAALAKIQSHSKRLKPVQFSPVVDVDKWFTPAVKRDLGELLAAIKRIDSPSLRRFMEICFSNCIRKVSLADPRMSVPVRKPNLRAKKRVNVRKTFEKCVQLNTVRLQRLQLIQSNLLQTARVLADARQLDAANSNLNVDLIITSPPYLGAQKYIRASSLSIGWLGLAPENRLRNLERQCIGREHFSKSEYEALAAPADRMGGVALRRLWHRNPLRAHIAATYLNEMKEALLESCRHLRRGGHFVLVIGDNSVCGKPFRTSRYLRKILTDAGLTVRLELIDQIRSRGLMTKRNKTAGLISREHIFVLRKD